MAIWSADNVRVAIGCVETSVSEKVVARSEEPLRSSIVTCPSGSGTRVASASVVARSSTYSRSSTTTANRPDPMLRRPAHSRGATEAMRSTGGGVVDVGGVDVGVDVGVESGWEGLPRDVSAIVMTAASAATAPTRIHGTRRSAVRSNRDSSSPASRSIGSRSTGSGSSGIGIEPRASAQ